MRIRPHLTTVAVSGALVIGVAAATSGASSTPKLEPVPVVAPVSLPGYLTSVGFVPPAARSAPRMGSFTPAQQPVELPATALPAPTLLPIPAVVIGALGIPENILAAYRAAADAMAEEAPACGLPWNLLAAIGRIESGHAHGGAVDGAGTASSILGPVLNGTLAGNDVISDTDGGTLDGDAGHDRAVGPMQFIPGTWARYGTDGNDDGVADPDNIYDATLAAGRYLCSGGLDLRDPGQESAAVFRYNNSAAYVADVMAWSTAYSAAGVGSDAPPVEPAVPVLEVAAPAPEPTPAPMPPPLPLAFGIPGLPPLPCLVFCPPTP